MLRCIRLDPAPLLYGPTALHAGRGGSGESFGIAHCLQQPGHVGVYDPLRAIVRFRVVAENRDPVLAFAQVVTNAVDAVAFVVLALAAGRLHGLEVCHSISVSGIWPDPADSL